MALLKKVEKKPLRETPWQNRSQGVSSARPILGEKPAPCSVACPLGNDVRGAMALVAQRDKLGLTAEAAFDQAWRLLAATQPFPAVVGRICPHPCEALCNRREKDDAVAVHGFERFLGDWGLARGLALPRAADFSPRDERVAVIGAGPSGLACAYGLARHGYGVTVLERMALPGGTLRYGIPAYRLPRAVLAAEITRLEALGVVFQFETNVGVTNAQHLTLAALQRDFAAVYVGIGAQRGRTLGVPGEHGPGVWSGIDFLRQVNAGEMPPLGPRVVVCGDGETAIDAARMALCVGKAQGLPSFGVTLVRGHGADVPGLADLTEDGIELLFEALPTAVTRDASGAVTRVTLCRATLLPPNARGLRLPRPVPGTKLELAASTLITAVSQLPEWERLLPSAPPLPSDSPWLAVDAFGRHATLGVWAGGDDVALGSAASAIAQGQSAARSIIASLRGEALPARPERRPIQVGQVKLDGYDPKPRVALRSLGAAERLARPDAEHAHGPTEAEVLYEAGRCLSCGQCFGCERCWMYCTPGCFHKRTPTAATPQYFDIHSATCDGCSKCADLCPCGFIEMLG